MGGIDILSSGKIDTLSSEALVVPFGGELKFKNSEIWVVDPKIMDSFIVPATSVFNFTKTGVGVFHYLNQTIDKRLFTIHPKILNQTNFSEIIQGANNISEAISSLVAKNATELHGTSDFLFKRKVKFVIPQYVIDEGHNLEEYFSNIGSRDVLLDHFHINLFEAATKANLTVTSKIDSLNDFFVVRDFYYNELLNSNSTNLELRKKFAKNVFMIRGFADYPYEENVIQLGIMGPNRYMKSTENLFTESLQEIQRNLNDPKTFTLFLGTLSRFCTKQFVKSKSIFIDEIYPQLEKLDPVVQKYQMDRFKKCMEIAFILYQKGWQITSFVGRNKKDLQFWKDNYPWVNVIVFEKVNHQSYLKYLQRHTFFFSHFFKTYGLPFYECLQNGIPVFLFEENCPNLIFRNMKNSVIFSSKLYNSVIVQIIEQFYEYFEKEQFDEIKKDANELFAAETFGIRLIHALRQRQLIE